jgi:hypothetical protein
VPAHLARLGGTPEAAGPLLHQHPRMNRNRHNIPRDQTTRMVHGQGQSETYSWLRTLREIRALRERPA